MELRDSPDESRFRAEVRSWFTENLPEGWGTPAFALPDDLGERVAFFKGWQRRLYDGGWAGISWPRAYGGRELPVSKKLIFEEESAHADAPTPVDLGVGPALAGPTLVGCGSERQKARYLEAILKGEEYWCQGFSEPESGSDLASLQCRGEVRGDEIVVTGRKIWTTYARFSEWCLLIVRTDPDSTRHRGLTVLLVDMASPGIEVRPLRVMTGVEWFNEVAFDGVRVPVENVVGRIHGGWDVVLYTLAHERGGGAYHAGSQRFLERLIELARRTPRGGEPALRDPVLRQELARHAADLRALRMSIYRTAAQIESTGSPGVEGSTVKLQGSELQQRMAETALEILGPAALVPQGDPGAVDGGYWAYELLWTRAVTIYAGTSEIQRNIIAERVLGLPRA